MHELITFHQIEMEARFLSNCLIDTDFAHQWIGKLETSHFYNSTYSKIYEIMVRIVDAGRELTQTEIGKELTAAECSEMVALIEKHEYVSSSYLYMQLEGCRKIRNMGKFILQYKCNYQEESALDNFINQILRISDNCSNDNIADMKKLTSDCLEEWEKGLNVRKEYKINLPRLSDRLVLKAGYLVYVIAPPKTGKTWFLCNLAAQLAQEKHKVLFITLEMNVIDLYTRIASFISDIDLNRVNTPKVKMFSQHISEITALPLSMMNATGITSIQLQSILRRTATQKYDAIFIDYLQRINNPFAKDMRISINQTSGMLADMSKKHNLLIFCASQAGRVANTSEVTEVYHAKESGNIEADADTLITLKDSTDYETNPCYNTLRLKIVQRNGYTGTTSLDFNPETGRFV